VACSAKSLSRLKDKHKDTVMQLIAFYSWVAEIPEDDKSNSALLHEETFPNEETASFGEYLTATEVLSQYRTQIVRGTEFIDFDRTKMSTLGQLMCIYK